MKRPNNNIMINTFGDTLTENWLEIKKTGNPQFKYLKWLLCGTSVDRTRPIINCLYVDEDGMTTTNGRSLHRCAPMRDIPPGIWWPEVDQSARVLLREISGMNYPNYRQVIPDDEAKGRFKHDSEFEYDKEGVWMVQKGIALDNQLLKNILWGGGVAKKEDKVTCKTVIEPETEPSSFAPKGTKGPPGPVTFHFRDWSRFAVLMPIRA